MKICLLHEPNNSQLGSMLETLCKDYQWTLECIELPEVNQQKNAKNIEIDLSVLTNQKIDALIVHINNEELLTQFLNTYRSTLYSDSSFLHIYLFSDKYNHCDAAVITALQTISYLVTPTNKEQLKHYLINTIDQKNTILDNTASMLHSQFALMLDESAIISMTDLTGAIVYANDNFCETSGYTRKELLGKTHDFLKSGRHTKHEYQQLWKAILSGQNWRGYFCNRKKDGSEFWVDSAIYPVADSAGEIYGYVAIRYDVSKEMELKKRLIESESRFKISHAFAMIGSWEWTIETGIITISDEVHKLYNRKESATETTFDTFIKLTHPEDQAYVSSQVDDCIKNGEEIRLEHRAMLPDGNFRWLSQRGKVIRDKKGCPSRILGVMSDVHDLKVAQEAAIEAEQLKSAFISTLSHEIRNPLNALNGYNQLISDLSTNQTIKNYAKNNEKIIRHISDILVDINLNTKLESGNVVQNITTINVKDLIQESIEMTDFTLNNTNLIIESTFGYVFADPLRIRQVLMNLLSNACKYNVDGGYVFIRTLEKPTGYIRIEVEDTGHGIAQQQLDQVFKPYERLEWNKSEIDGLGLGLSICKLLVEGMKGKVGATSNKDQGSTFWIELPLSQEAEAELTPEAPSQEQLQELPKKVLVLEDNEFNREFMQQQLENLGIQATFAENGFEGLDKLEQESFDVIMTDLNMPKMDGQEFIKNVREHANKALQELPIIIISAYSCADKNSGSTKCSFKSTDGSNSDGKEIISHEKTSFLAKPFTLKELTAALAREFTGQENTDTNQNEADAPVINIETMKLFLGDNPEPRNRLLFIYLNNLKAMLPKLCKAFETGNEQELLSLVHKLAASSTSVGAESFSNYLKQLECDLEQGNYHLSPEDDTNELKHLSSKVIDRIQELLNEQPSQHNKPVQRSKDNENTRILVVDDDNFFIAQISEKLSRIKSVSFQTETNTSKALKRLHDESFNIIILDLDMPNIDGIQFIRLFAPIYRQQALVLSSAKKSLISPTAQLIEKYNMHYLGAMDKPCSNPVIYRLIKQYNQSFDVNESTVTPLLHDDQIVHCINQNKILVLYQPQIELSTNSVTSVEALSRLILDDGSIAAPNTYLQRLEELGLEVDFANKVASQAINQLSLWNKDNHNLKLAINFSMFALEDLELPNHLKSCCDTNNINTESIIIEVTETALSTQPKLVLEVLVRLKLLGFTLSIDDFGTGYSSLEKLQKLPFTEMKLDRSYVSNAKQDEVSMALLTSSLGLASQLNMTTVAEGIETVEDLELVACSGANLVQGFYFAKPLNATQLIAWKKEYNNASEYCA